MSAHDRIPFRPPVSSPPGPPTIEEVAAAALDLPLTEPFAIATGTQHVAHNVVGQVRRRDGTIGLGEAAPFGAVSGETQEQALAALAAVRALPIGDDVRAWRPITRLLDEELASQPAARRAIEMALLDALTRHHHIPLWSFFGGAGTRLETDMTVTAGDCRHAAQAASQAWARGIRTLKVKIGAGTPAEDTDRLQAIAQAVPGATLVVDANGGYTVTEAVELLRRAEQAGIALALFEQPVPRDDWSGMTEVTRQSRVPVCADESARSAADVMPIIQRQSAPAINIKLMKCGVVEALDMWALARADGLELMIGGMVESILAMTFSAHFAAGIGGFSCVDLDTPMFIAHHPFIGDFHQHGARPEVSHASAGHGVTLAQWPPPARGNNRCKPLSNPA